MASAKTENKPIVAVVNVVEASEVVCLATVEPELEDDELVKLVVAFLEPYAEVLTAATEDELLLLVFIVVELAEWLEEARPMTGVGSLVTLLTLEVVFDWEVFETDDEAVLDEADVLFEASSLLPASTTLMLS